MQAACNQHPLQVRLTVLTLHSYPALHLTAAHAERHLALLLCKRTRARQLLWRIRCLRILHRRIRSPPRNLESIWCP